MSIEMSWKMLTEQPTGFDMSLHGEETLIELTELSTNGDLAVALWMDGSISMAVEFAFVAQILGGTKTSDN